MGRRWKDYAFITLKGIAMGAADVVPGVSGGTIAFIVGIYEELLDSIKSINLSNLKLLLQGKIGAFWKSVNGSFLLSLIIGIGISILSLARIITYLLVHQPVLIWDCGYSGRDPGSSPVHFPLRNDSHLRNDIAGHIGEFHPVTVR